MFFLGFFVMLDEVSDFILFLSNFFGSKEFKEFCEKTNFHKKRTYNLRVMKFLSFRIRLRQLK